MAAKTIKLLIVNLLPGSVSLFLALMVFTNTYAQRFDFRSMHLLEYQDRLLGSLTGKIVGAAWAKNFNRYPHGYFTPDSLIPGWRKDIISEGYTQASVVMELPFMACLQKTDMPVSFYHLPETMALYRSQAVGYEAVYRRNLLQGVRPPASGNALYNPEWDGTGWYRLADLVGRITPGMPKAARELSFRAGESCVSGEGILAATFVSCLTSELFAEQNLNAAVHTCLSVLPDSSQCHKQLTGIVSYQEQFPGDLNGLKKYVEETIIRPLRCMHDTVLYDYEPAWLNACYLTAALLHGNGNFEKTLKTLFVLGGDVFSNVPLAGSLLGIHLGYKQIPPVYIPNNITGEIYIGNTALNDYLETHKQIMKQILFLNGGTVKGKPPEERYIFPNDPLLPLPLLSYLLASDSSLIEAKCNYPLTFVFSSSKGKEYKYTWFFGDLATDTSSKVTHVYDEAGTYEVLCLISHVDGGTESQRMYVEAKRALPVVPITYSNFHDSPLVNIPSFLEEGSTVELALKVPYGPQQKYIQELYLDTLRLSPQLLDRFRYRLQAHDAGKRWVYLLTKNQSGQIVHQDIQPVIVGKTLFKYDKTDTLFGSGQISADWDSLTLGERSSFYFRLRWDNDQLYTDLIQKNQAVPYDSTVGDTHVVHKIRYLKQPFVLNLAFDKEHFTKTDCDTSGLLARFSSAAEVFHLNSMYFLEEDWLNQQDLVSGTYFRFSIPWRFAGFKPEKGSVFKCTLEISPDTKEKTESPGFSFRYVRLGK